MVCGLEWISSTGNYNHGRRRCMRAGLEATRRACARAFSLFTSPGRSDHVVVATDGRGCKTLVQESNPYRSDAWRCRFSEVLSARETALFAEKIKSAASRNGHF